MEKEGLGEHNGDLWEQIEVPVGAGPDRWSSKVERRLWKC